MVHKYLDPANAKTFDALALKTDSKFDLYYFGVHALGATCRTILAISGANFETTAPANDTWVTQYKPMTPFGVMPILRETSMDGSLILNITESDAIERYLSRKFGYLGKTPYEEMVINMFNCSNQWMMNNLFQKYFSVSENPELKAENKAKLVSTQIPDWIKYHEQHLSENPVAVAQGQKHGNGHYVGDNYSLADLKTVFLIDSIQGMTGEGLISSEKTPALWKVKQVVEEKDSVKAWKETAAYKEISEHNYTAMGYY